MLRTLCQHWHYDISYRSIVSLSCPLLPEYLITVLKKMIKKKKKRVQKALPRTMLTLRWYVLVGAVGAGGRMERANCETRGQTWKSSDRNLDCVVLLMRRPGKTFRGRARLALWIERGQSGRTGRLAWRRDSMVGRCAKVSWTAMQGSAWTWVCSGATELEWDFCCRFALMTLWQMRWNLCSSPRRSTFLCH